VTSRTGRRNHRDARSKVVATPRASRSAWLAPPIGIVVIVVLAFAASRAQATTEVFVAAALVFSLCEGLVLAIVGWTWSPRGRVAAAVAAAVTATLAAPARWQVASTIQPTPPMDLAVDLLVSLAWGALAGLAGATILRSKLGALMQNDRQRFRAP
jgi:hypothetical protein